MPKIPKHLLARAGSSAGGVSGKGHSPLGVPLRVPWVVKKPGDAEGYHPASSPLFPGRTDLKVKSYASIS